MAEIVPVVSEALEATIRDLLPSQRGFGEDLQASNVITPIIDLTPTAEGSNLREDLQKSLDFAVTQVQRLTAGSSAINPGTGFWRIYGNLQLGPSATANTSITINMTDGLSVKPIFETTSHDPSAGDRAVDAENFDFIVFLKAGDSLTLVTDSNTQKANLFYRQIATVNGTLVTPLGYSGQ